MRDISKGNRMNSFKRLMHAWAVFAALMLSFPMASAQVCPISCNVTGSINDYWPGTANVAVGASSITLGARRAGTGTAGNTIAAGDWVIVVQMQDATIGTANSTSYGSTVAGNTGTGYISAGQSGLYEFARATNAVGAAGGTLNLASALVNAYDSTVSGTQTTPRFQVVRIPHCVTVNMSGTIDGAPWNGTTGGVIALRGETVNMGGATINANGIGFRGGATDAHNGPTDTNNWNGTTVTDQYKGEGIAGTPNFIYDTATATEIATGLTFPGGSNAGRGGRGGTWSGTTGGAAGGRGGAPFAERAFTRLVLGGGGAGGSAGADAGYAAGSAQETSPPFGTGTNAFSRGGAGGGLVILGANTRAASLTVNANGVSGPFSPGTANATQVGGGGGGGGSIVLYGSGGTISANAAGGDGTPAQRAVHLAHGGGGGGGAVFASGALTGITTSVTGGRAGCTVAGANDTNATNCGTDNNSSTAGAAGVATTFAASAGPGTPTCAPAALSVTKSNNLTTVTAGQTFTYSLTVVNSGPTAANNSVLRDPAVAGLSCTSVACTGSNPAGNCPGVSVTIADLQGGGIGLPTLPASSTLTFGVTCGVTATGQ
jgi:uncharacterized repeat protein (TIGR01451 family)